MTTRTFGFAIIAAVVGFPVHSASFDCAKAEAPIEHLLCDFPALNALDAEMGALHIFMRRDQTTYMRDTLKDQQIVWINSRYLACGIPRKGQILRSEQSQKASCLAKSICIRIEQMRIWLGPAGRAFDREIESYRLK